MFILDSCGIVLYKTIALFSRLSRVRFRKSALEAFSSNPVRLFI
jgi:hypothetical protein